MVIYEAKITASLDLSDVVSRLFQGFIFKHIAPYEHDGFQHLSGKVFKSSVFKIDYSKNSKTIKILFSSLIPETENRFLDHILKHGMKLGTIKLYDESINIIKQEWKSDNIVFLGDVLLTLKDTSGKKVFLEPRSDRFQDNIKRQSFQKFETLLKKEYFGDWKLEVLKQSKNKTKIYYNRKPYFTWFAEYRLNANKEMINLILNSGFGSHTMKGFGLVKVKKENF